MLPKHTGERHRFIDEMGRLFEQSALPRMAGKMFGVFLISGSGPLSADQIAGAVHASRGSVSTMTRLLIQARLVERVRLPGDRKDYFRVKPGMAVAILRGKMSQISDLRMLLDQALAFLERKDPARSDLEEMSEFYAFVESELGEMIARWEHSRRRARSGAAG